MHCPFGPKWSNAEVNNGIPDMLDDFGDDYKIIKILAPHNFEVRLRFYFGLDDQDNYKTAITVTYDKNDPALHKRTEWWHTPLTRE